MANTYPGGLDLNTSPYFDDYDEDKKFVKVLYRPGRAVQARELTQAQTLQQVQTKRFAEYFFKQGSLVDGCEQNLDLNLSFVKLQPTYNSNTVAVANFDGSIIYGANSGIKAYSGLVTDVDGDDPKTLFISYATNGTQVLTVNVAPSTLTSGNTITFSTGNTATIEAFYTDPISGAIRIFVSNTSGTLTATTANTVLSTGAIQVINVTNVSDQSANTSFANSETIFTANTTARSYALAAATNAVRNVVDEGLATQQIYNYGSKITVSEGVVYLADHFVKHSTQTIILDKYTNEPSYKIGVVPNKSFVDYIEDQSLVDNAQGTPNFQAPGADRLKIDTTLTKIALDASTDENEFVTITEIEDGVVRKRKSITVDSKLEDVLAKRTQEESGNYTLSDPIVYIREHLTTSGDDTGVYTSAEGGNSDLLVVEVDPFTSYVSGYRNQIIIKTQIQVEKGLDSEYVNGTSTQINYGQYIEVKELVGAWDIMESTTVDLYDTPQQVITNLVHSTATAAGSAIGTARVRSIKYVSGDKGTADARYYLYLYDIVMSAGKNFKDVRSIFDSATPKRFADIVTTAAGAVLQETSFDTMIFPFGYEAIKTVRDLSENVDTAFRFKKKFTVSFTTGVATIATDVVSETFVGTGVLNADQKNNSYMVVVNNAGANVETSALTGTVTVGASSTAVTGSGTLFTTQYNVGDLIKIGSTTTHRIASIASATALTLSAAHGAGATAVAHTKILPTGTVLSLSANGGSGATRTVNVTSPGTVAIDVKENATFTADVIVSMDRANAKEKVKTLSFQTQANINPNVHPNGLSGPFGLGVGDIYQLHAVYQSTDFNTAATTANTNVTSNYVLDNGQRDYAYEHGTITPITGYVPTGRLLVVFDNFTHDTSQGVGYTSVNSYPVDDDASSNTTITTGDIPTFTSPTTKKIIKLRDCLDFRPIKTANTSLNPIDVGTYQIPTFGLRIPETSSSVTADLIYYKGRVSKVYINNAGVFGINDGVPTPSGNQRAESPPTKPDTLEIAELTIPPYPSLPVDVQIKLLKNKRFTMREVARMNERLERLEYFTALSFLEKQATDTTELDNDGLDRFKNGILVDPFTGWSVASTSSDGKDCAIDTTNKFLTGKKDNTKTVLLSYSTTAPIASTAEKQTGNKIMLPYTEVLAPGLKQQYASRQLRLAEELSYIYTGDLSVMPFGDSFFETENLKNQAIVYNDDNGADNWKALTDAWNTEVAPLNQRWLGVADGGKIETVDTNQIVTTQGNQRVTTALRTVTQDAFNKIATGNFTGASKQEVSFDRVVSVEVALWMRQREFVIHATGLKNNARVYAFFDGVNVTANCYQIAMLGASTLQSLNTFAANTTTGIFELTGANTTWKPIADGANTAQPFIVKNGEIFLLFEVPKHKFYTGQREFKITDSPTNSDGTMLTSARNIITSQGVLTKTANFSINSRPPTNVQFNTVRNIGRKTVSSERVEIDRQTIPPPAPPPGVDPLSQSFFVDPNTFQKGMYVTSIDLFFRTKPTWVPDSANESPNANTAYVTIDIRELDNGFPSPELVSSTDNAKVDNDNINISEDASLPTKFTFKNPIFLSPGVDYCFTVKPSYNDPNFALWVAELGAIDITQPNKQSRIESAYNSGVLFSSSNDKTWTVKQNIDMKFTMRVAEFSTTDSKVAFWTNTPISTAIAYDALTPMIADVVLPGTNIKYEIKTSDSSLAVDEEFTAIKKYERLVLRSRKQISNTSVETTGSMKSLLLKATLSTTNKYITPYVDNEKLEFNFDKNIINNLDSTAVTGTVEYASGNNVVIGTGTTFTTQVFPGEYAYFGDEYRRVSSVTSNTVLTVVNNFTTSNAVSQAMSIRNEENPTGPYSSQSRYITKVVTLNDGFEAADLVTYLRINRPPGTSIQVYCKLLNENDTDAFDDKFYTPMELVGTETFTLNQNEYKEEKYVVPSVAKTGGSELLAGTVAISNVSTTVTGTSTRFIEDLKIGDTIAVGTARTERVVASITNNISLVVESAFSTVASTQDIFRVLNNTVAYTTPDGRTFQGYKNFAIKIVLLSSSPSYAPKIKDLRGIALA